jgi:predicted aspartyl protease
MSLATVPSCNCARSAMDWRHLYQAALFETDRRNVPHRIDEAEKAILARVEELFVVASDHIEEDVILDDALYGLRALRTCVMLRSDAA